MAGDWETVPLRELVEPNRGISYGIVQPGAPVSEGIPIVRVSDVRNRRVQVDKPLKVSPTIEAAYSRTRLKGGELLLTLVGTVGEAAVVPSSLAGWNVARAVAVIPIRKEIGSYWVQLALQLPEVRHLIDSRLNTTVQATLNLRDVSELPIVLPPSREREIIAHILGTLDKKIELNQRMNETAQALARALFKSWFVDFDLIRAKGDGKDTGLPEHIDDLIPASFDSSELGEIPIGWKLRGLDEIARFLNGLALQKYPPSGENYLPVIKIAQLRSGDVIGADQASAGIDSTYIVADGDVLFSWSGSLECVLWAGGKGALNQHLFKVTSSEYPKWLYYLWINQHLDEFRRIAAGKATTMGHIQRHHLSEAKVVLPPQKLIEAIDPIFAPLIESQWQREVQSRTLAAVRDTLLPKLISGELRVSNLGSFGVGHA